MAARDGNDFLPIADWQCTIRSQRDDRGKSRGGGPGQIETAGAGLISARLPGVAGVMERGKGGGE